MLPRLLLYLLVTWAVETLVALILLRLWKNPRGRLNAPLLRDTFLVNALTNPLANYAGLAWHTDFWLTEGVVFVVEAPLYRAVLGLTWREAIILSALANGVSLSLSFVL